MASWEIARKETDSGKTEETVLAAGDSDDISTTSSDDALCDILGLTSLSGMDMREDCADDHSLANSSAIPTGIPTRIKLPSARGVSRKYYPSEECFAYEIQDILSPDECRKLIQVAANSSTGNQDTISSFRYITHAMHTAPDGTKFEVKLERPNPHKLAVFGHEEWVKILWSRIEPFLRKDFYATNICGGADREKRTLESDDCPDKSDSKNPSLNQAIDHFIQRESLFVSSQRKTSPIAGINPRLRVLKYDASDDDEFQGHFDATTEIHSLGQTSYLTVLLYLNDGGGKDFDGGETEFLSQDDPHDVEFHHQLPGSGTVKIVPKAGTAVLFEHDLFHRGRPLLWGTKYVLRTDIMFVHPPKHSEEITSIPSANQQRNNERIPSWPSSPNSVDETAGMPLSTVEDVLSLIDQELSAKHSFSENSEVKITTQISSMTRLRDALSEGLGFGEDLRDTSIECLCSPGRFALNLVLREYMQHQHEQRIIDLFLDESFEAVKRAKK